MFSQTTAANARWQCPTDIPVLKHDEVHVWLASLDPPLCWMRRLEHLLSDDERIRAVRFRFRKDSERFIVSRGLLRVLLGRYLDIEPNQLRFSYSSNGKPELAPSTGASRLHFNLSHSGSFAIYAITLRRAIGIDIERIREDVTGMEIAKRFFSPWENAALHALPPNMRQLAFFNCWTRKEAYLKARGGGLSLSLDDFDVSLAPGEPAMLLSSRIDPNERLRWSLMHLAPHTDYVAAVAVESKDYRSKYWTWSLDLYYSLLEPN